jgi:hypothetical integral membrane protein (TIGR02206 family)
MPIFDLAWQFSPHSNTHYAVLLAIVAMGVGLVWLGRQKPTIVHAAVLLLLFGGWTLNLVNDLRPMRISAAQSLPLHLCDVVGLIGILAFARGWRPARAVLFCWGFGLCSIALVQPALTEGPRMTGFWAYWLCHAAITLAVVVDVGVQGFRPSWRDAGVAIGLLAAYIVMITPVNVLLDVNYGYAGNATDPREMVTAFGAWPGRLLTMLGTASVIMLLLVLPFATRHWTRAMAGATVSRCRMWEVRTSRLLASAGGKVGENRHIFLSRTQAVH